MGTYCTNTAVINEFPIFPQTTEVSRYTETSLLITEKIARSESVINSYLGRRYTVPFTATPPMVETICINLSAYYTLNAKFTKDSHNTNEWVEKLKKDAFKDLEMIRDRKIDLVNTSGAVIEDKNASSRVISNTQDYQPFADVDTATSWRVDPNLEAEVKGNRGF